MFGASSQHERIPAFNGLQCVHLVADAIGIVGMVKAKLKSTLAGVQGSDSFNANRGITPKLATELIANKFGGVPRRRNERKTVGFVDDRTPRQGQVSSGLVTAP